MTQPSFTIAVPTKNRPTRVRDAVQSLVSQTFADVEILVCDNSDADAADETRKAALSSRDDRVRYVRTNGRLSMPDNWERAVGEAEGTYVGVLTDRSVFRPDALEVVQRAIVETGAPLVSWFCDSYARDPQGRSFRRRPCTARRYDLDAERILTYFLGGHPKYATKIVPKLMTGVCRRDILEGIRASPVGRCCPPVAPDFTSGFLMTSHASRVLFLDEALYISCGSGNGTAFRRRGELADRFRVELGMAWEDMVDHMPTQACFAHALVLNDLMRLRELDPARFGHLEINRVQYYLGCAYDYLKTARQGIRRDDDWQLLLAGLEKEARQVRASVRNARVFLKAMALHTSAAAPTSGEREDEHAGSFDSVFAAIAWDAEHPREPARASFLDVLPPLTSIEDSVSTHRIARAELPPATGRDAYRRAVRRLRYRMRLRTRLRSFLPAHGETRRA